MTSSQFTQTNSPQELIDVVDKHDVVVSQASRKEVHDKKLLHREVAVLIYDDQNRILTQQRSSKKKVMPLYWIISVAGHVPAGMTPEEAAHKELIEELGFDTELSLYTKELLDYGFENHFAYGYIGKISEGTVPVVDKNEIEQIRFASRADLEEMLKEGEQIEEYSLRDFQKFFAGEFDRFLKQ